MWTKNTLLLLPVILLGYSNAFASENDPISKSSRSTYTFNNAIPAPQLFEDTTFGKKVRGLTLVFHGRTDPGHHLYFAEVGFRETTPGVPVILDHYNGQWLAILLGRLSPSDQTKAPIPHDLRGSHWQQVVGLYGSGMLFAILEYGFGDPGPIAFLASSDQGQTWELRSILKKMIYTAQFHDLAMTKEGVGRITVALLDPESESAMGFKPGFYHYRTKDRGFTWSSPEYEAHDTGVKFSNHFYWKGTKLPENLHPLNPFISSFEQLLLLKYD